MTTGHMASAMTPDSAWRQLRHLIKRRNDLSAQLGVDADLSGLNKNIDAARNVWLTCLFNAFEHQKEKAIESGKDLGDAAVLYQCGLPCITCMMPATAGSGHRIHKADPKDARWTIYATCKTGTPADPTVTAMPEIASIWP